MTFERELSLLISDPMFVLDPDGRVCQANQSAFALLAWDPELAIGLHHHELWPFLQFSSSTCIACETLDQARARQPLAAGSINVVASGEKRPIQVTKIPIWRENCFLGVGLVLTDRTAERRNDALVVCLLRMLVEALAMSGGANGNGSGGEPPDAAGKYGLELTWREREVLHCMVAGMNARAIASRLSVTHHTARNHVRNVLHKLEAHSKAEAVAHAVARQLIDPGELTAILAGGPRPGREIERSA